MDLFVLEMLFQSVHVRVQVNGVELVVDETAGSKTIATKINPYVVDGPNRVTAALRLPASVPGAPPPPAPEFVLRLIGGTHGADPGDAGRLAEYEWSAAQPLSPDGYRGVFDHTVPIASPFGRWSWQDAPAASLAQNERSALLAEVEALHRAAVARDSHQVLAHHRLKFVEMARALDLLEADLYIDMTDALATMFSAPDFAIAPMDPALELQPLADGKLVRVAAPGGRAPIRLSGGDQSLQILPVYTRKDGRWIMAR